MQSRTTKSFATASCAASPRSPPGCQSLDCINRAERERLREAGGASHLRACRTDVQAGFTPAVEDAPTVTGLGAGPPPLAVAGSASLGRRLLGDGSRVRTAIA